MAFTGLVFEVSFVVIMHLVGASPLYHGKDALLQSRKCASKMIFLFAALASFYHIMAFDQGWVHQNWLADWMGNPGVAVYSTRYIEWTFCAPILLSVAGTLEPRDGHPRNGLLPSSLLTGIYCLNSWIAFVVMDTQTAWWNVFISFVAYFACSWEQLAFAWHVRQQGPAGAVRCVMLIYLVVVMGVYGAVYLMPLWGMCSTEFEQNFYSCADASFKIGMACVLIAQQHLEDTSLVNRLRQYSENMAADLTRLIDTASVPIFGIDQDCLINEWNHKMALLTGLSSEEARGRLLFDLFKGVCREEGERMFRDSLGGLETGSCELRMEIPEGPGDQRTATLVVSASPRRDMQGVVVGAFGVGYDLTEIKAVREAEIRKTRFMAVMSHELRSPLHGVIGLSGALQCQEKNAVRAKQLKLIKNCAGRLLELVVNIMDMAALSAQEDGEKVRKRRSEVLVRDPVDLSRIIEDVTMIVKSSTDKTGCPLLQRGVKLVNEVAEDLPVIEGDAYRCTQIFHNLISNACKFTHRGEIRVTSKVPPSRTHVEINVSDTGKGIARDALDRVFEPFEQEDTSEIRHFEGIGLGLSIAKELVERHGGTISVSSQVGVGTKFTVQLPAVMVSQYGSNSVSTEEDLPSPTCKVCVPGQYRFGEAHTPASTGSAGHPERKVKDEADYRSGRSDGSQVSLASSRRALILLVGADPDEEEAMEAAFADDYDVKKARSAEACLELFHRSVQVPDIVVARASLPAEISGLELCQILREELQCSALTLPIVVFSEDADDALEAFCRGGTDFVSRPLDIDLLLMRIKAALHMKMLHNMQIKSAVDAGSLSTKSLLRRASAPQAVPLPPSRHPSLTMLAAEVGGWGDLAGALSAAQVVALLNELFAAFDALATVQGVQKQEASGATYACAFGVNGDAEHAARAVKLGLGMLQATHVVQPPVAGTKLLVRVGVHTGPAFAGAIGRQAPRLCFFGETVGMTSRLEVSGVPGCVHISQATLSALGGVEDALGPGVQVVRRPPLGGMKIDGAKCTHLVVPCGGSAGDVLREEGEEERRLALESLARAESEVRLRSLERAQADAEGEAHAAQRELAERSATFERQLSELRSELQAAGARGAQLQDRAREAEGKLAAARLELEACRQAAAAQLGESKATQTAHPDVSVGHGEEGADADWGGGHGHCHGSAASSGQTPPGQAAARAAPQPATGSPASPRLPAAPGPASSAAGSSDQPLRPPSGAVQMLEAQERRIRHLELDLRLKEQRLSAARAAETALQDRLDSATLELHISRLGPWGPGSGPGHASHR